MQVTLIGESTPRQMPVNGAATTTTLATTGNEIYKETIHNVFQLISAAAATAIIEGSLDGQNWCPVTGTASTSTITLTGAGTGAIVEASSWRYVRCRLTSASAATSCLMGV